MIKVINFAIEDMKKNNYVKKSFKFWKKQNEELTKNGYVALSYYFNDLLRTLSIDECRKRKL